MRSLSCRFNPEAEKVRGATAQQSPVDCTARPSFGMIISPRSRQLWRESNNGLQTSWTSDPTGARRATFYVRDAEEAAYRESRHRRGRDDYHYGPEAAPNHIFHRIVLLGRWLDGTVDRDGTPR